MIHLGKDTRDSNNESKSSQPIRKGAEVDKFGFYHAAAPASASMQHDGTFYFLNCVHGTARKSVHFYYCFY